MYKNNQCTRSENLVSPKISDLTLHKPWREKPLSVSISYFVFNLNGFVHIHEQLSWLCVVAGGVLSVQPGSGPRVLGLLPELDRG